MLKAITIENFKGIGAPQRIELKPITLLFGPNSAGKSTVLHALNYAREILCNGNLDPAVTQPAGESGAIDHFQRIVHGHDLSRPIRFRFEMQYDEDEVRHNSPPFSRDVVVTFELEIVWSQIEDAPVVRRYAVELDGSLCAEIVHEPGQEGSTLKILSDHASYERATYEGIIDTCGGGLDGLNVAYHLFEGTDTCQYLQAAEAGVLDDFPDISGPEESVIEIYFQLIQFFSMTPAGQDPNDPFHTLPLGRSWKDARPQKRLGIDWDSATIPSDLYPDLNLDERFEKDGQTPGHHVLATGLHHELSEEFNQNFSDLILLPAHTLARSLRYLTSIGPIRRTPTDPYTYQDPDSPGRWSTGLAAWDVLCGYSREAFSDNSKKALRSLQEFNDWLGSSHRLDCGYTIELKQFLQFDTRSLLGNALAKGPDEFLEIVESTAFLSELAHSWPDKHLSMRFVIRPTDGQPIDLNLEEVGEGVRQIIPVVVAALQRRRSPLIVEEPETHLNPRIIAALGDLFIESIRSSKRPFVVVETHSEHLILRLLRRIRETTEHDDSSSPRSTSEQLTHEELAVNFLEHKNGSTHVQNLRVDKDGEFIDRWPHGFFDEREPELL